MPRNRYDIPITDETFPWIQPKGPYSHFSDDGPVLKTTFTIVGVMMRVSPTSETGCDTGRTRFKVECLTCNELLHPATTSSTIRAADHLHEVHNWDGEAWDREATIPKVVA